MKSLTFLALAAVTAANKLNQEKSVFCQILGKRDAAVKLEHFNSLIDSARKSGIPLPANMEAEVGQRLDQYDLADDL